MTAGAQSFPISVSSEESTTSRRWIESPLFDSVLFALPTLTTLPLIALTLLVDLRFGVLFFLLSFPHYMSTLTFFLWDENQERHRVRALAFFGGPILIAAAFAVFVFAGLPRIIEAAVFVWNTFHVAAQNCGILSIYRHRAGVFDPGQKRAANFAIVAVSFWLACWNIGSLNAFTPLLKIWRDYAIVLQFGLGAIALFALLRLLIALRGRSAEGKSVRLPEAMFLLGALAFFHPYLWLSDALAATAIMLVPHYLQYLAIVWLLHRRRFRQLEGSRRQQMLQRISASTPKLLVALLGLGVAIVAISIVMRHSGHTLLFQSLFTLVAIEHFYLDGLFWAFKDPSVRRSYSPYLTTYVPPQRAAAA